MTAVAQHDVVSKKEYVETTRLINVFNQTFEKSHNTRLVRGQDEPVYYPADEQYSYHRIVFAHGFFASALHEIAHWCLAGEKRRQLVDYGYWYCPDGRDEKQQREFENVEIKPQAIEKALSIASSRKFDVSTDNLSGAQPNREAFRSNVNRQYRTYCLNSFPDRAEIMINTLARQFGGLNLMQQKQAISEHE